jgi:hypothetical protein
MNVIAAANAFNETAVRQNWGQSCDPSLAFSDSSYTKFLAVWRDKAGDRSMPSRSQMTARDLKDFLRDILLVQRETENGVTHYRWRLIGTNLTQIFGHQTGKFLDESLAPEHLARWNHVCGMILESAQPWRFLGHVHIQDREYLDAENLYVPLADDNGVPTFVMGFCRYTSRFQTRDVPETRVAAMQRGLL